MKFFDVVTSLVASIELLGRLIAQLDAFGRGRRWFADWLTAAVTYENLSLDLILDIRDARGRRAVLERRQRVRFLTRDPEIVRDLVWGEGKQLARYVPTGAKRLGVRREGPRQAVLLGLPRSQTKGDLASIRMRRLIECGFTESREYFETTFERPTRRVAMRVLFPRTRPPHEAYLVSSPPDARTKSIPIRYQADGRAFLSWRQSRPDTFRTYSLRWSW